MQVAEEGIGMGLMLTSLFDLKAQGTKVPTDLILSHSYIC